MIHGERDETFPPYLAEQMVSAIRAAGGTALYSQLKDAPHNIPEWYNGSPVMDWLLAHSRSRHAAPTDPRGLLKLNKSGFSPYAIVSEPRTMYWQSADTGNRRAQEQALFSKIQARGVIVESQSWQVVDTGGVSHGFRVEVPLEMQPSSKKDPSMVAVPARTMLSFCFVGTPEIAAKHLKDSPPTLKQGETLSTEMWIKTLGRAADAGRMSVGLCRIEIFTGN